MFDSNLATVTGTSHDYMKTGVNSKQFPPEFSLE